MRAKVATVAAFGCGGLTATAIFATGAYIWSTSSHEDVLNRGIRLASSSHADVMDVNRVRNELASVLRKKDCDWLVIDTTARFLPKGARFDQADVLAARNERPLKRIRLQMPDGQEVTLDCR